jgi:hypothetical protein
MKWLGMFSDTPITPRGNPLDTLCATLEEKCQYAPGERDMCILQHKFLVETKEGTRVTLQPHNAYRVGNIDIDPFGLWGSKRVL